MPKSSIMPPIIWQIMELCIWRNRLMHKQPFLWYSGLTSFATYLTNSTRTIPFTILKKKVEKSKRVWSVSVLYQKYLAAEIIIEASIIFSMPNFEASLFCPCHERSSLLYYCSKMPILYPRQASTRDLMQIQSMYC